MRHLPIAVFVALLLSSCAAPPSPPPPVVAAVPKPVVLDSFQRQLVAARAARRNHVPATDKAGAQLAYDSVVHNACEKVLLTGPDKYKPRCNRLLQPATPTIPASAAPTDQPQDPFRCDVPSEDADVLRACND